MKRTPRALESRLHPINWGAVAEVEVDSGGVEAVRLRDPDCALNERVRNANTLI